MMKRVSSAVGLWLIATLPLCAAELIHPGHVLGNSTASERTPQDVSLVSVASQSGSGVAASVAAALANATNASGGFLTFSGAFGTPTQLNVSSAISGGSLGCTGTPSSTTFLRGDCSWSTPPGTGTVTSVSAGFGIAVTGSPTVTPTVNYDPTQVGWDTRNRLINSGMLIDQVNAGASYTLAAASGVTNYTVDGWYCYESSAGTLLTAQQTSIKSGGVNYALQVQRGNTSTNTNATTCHQVVESNNMIDLQGQAVTFSVRALKGANWSAGTPTISIITGTGTDEGSASLAAGTWTGQSTCGSATPTLTGSFAFYVATCTIASGAKEVAVRVSWTWTGTAGAADYIQFTDAELVPGTYTAAQVVPERPSNQKQIAACQRYYQTSYGLGTAIGAATRNGIVGTGTSGTTMGGSVSFPTQMRAAPTVSFWDGAGNASKISTYGGSWTDNVSPTSIPLTSSAAGMMFYQSSASVYFQYAANARL